MPTSTLIPHVHVSAMEGVKTMLYVILGVGALYIVASRFEGHPLADAFLNIWA